MTARRFCVAAYDLMVESAIAGAATEDEAVTAIAELDELLDPDVEPSSTPPALMRSAVAALGGEVA